MNLHFSFKAGKTPDVEQEIQQQVSKLERRLRVFRPELVHLHGTLDERPREGFTISLNLRLPSGQLASQNVADNAIAAVKASFAELISQLNRHKELLRAEHRWKRQPSEPPISNIPGPETPAASALPRGNGTARQTFPLAGTPADLPQKRAPQRADSRASDDLRSALNANLGRLERYVKYELRYLQDSGQIPQDSISPEEVVDEVVVNALSAHETAPGLSVEKWLYRLALQAVRRIASGNSEPVGEISVDQPMGTQNVTGSDEEYLQFEQPDEYIDGLDKIADRRVSTPEEVAATDEFITQVQLALVSAKPEDREAFILCAIEGFTLKEIARITDRPEDQLRKSITNARDQLMRGLPPDNALRRHLLQHSNVA